MMPEDREPTARELAAQSQGQEYYTCPRCGSGPISVIDTYATRKGIRRRSVCYCRQKEWKSLEVFTPKGATVRVITNEDDEELERAAA
jgi:transcriptional regulator NrdR family protein